MRVLDDVDAVGVVLAITAALTIAASRRRRASGSICGRAISGSPMPSRSSSSWRSSSSAPGKRAAQLLPCGGVVQPVQTRCGSQQTRGGMERDLGGVRLAVGGEHVDAGIRGERGDLADDAALTDSRRADQPDDTSVAVDRSFENTVERAHLPLASDESRLCSVRPSAGRHPEQPASRHRILGALDVNLLGFTEQGDGIDQACGRVTHHHAAGRRHRLHALRHPDLFTDRGVRHRARTDFAGDHLTRIQADPQLQGDVIAALDVSRQALDVRLNVERGAACAHGVVLECDRRPEHGHDAVAGELVHSPAVALHDRPTSGGTPRP